MASAQCSEIPALCVGHPPIDPSFRRAPADSTANTSSVMQFALAQGPSTQLPVQSRASYWLTNRARHGRCRMSHALGLSELFWYSGTAFGLRFGFVLQTIYVGPDLCPPADGIPAIFLLWLCCAVRKKELSWKRLEFAGS